MKLNWGLLLSVQYLNANYRYVSTGTLFRYRWCLWIFCTRRYWAKGITEHPRKSNLRKLLRERDGLEAAREWNNIFSRVCLPLVKMSIWLRGVVIARGATNPRQSVRRLPSYPFTLFGFVKKEKNTWEIQGRLSAVTQIIHLPFALGNGYYFP